ncbi:amino acid adenylation domain-containing protein [Mucilaginibacter sp. UYCu711]|uniref:amino acid adenylation domain-containing protein n=1 Tax=Mucilaginibacter sp. UYCu711 TaxID=3156339 RepID=UPI003D1AD0FC
MNSEDIFQFWEQKFKKLILNDLPYEHPNPSSASDRHTLKLEIGKDIAANDGFLIINDNKSLFGLFFTVFNIILYRYTAQTELTVMVPVDLDNSAGDRSSENILPAQTKMQGTELVSDLLKEVLLEMKELQKYSQVGIESVLKEIKLESNVLDQILFTFDSRPDDAADGENGLKPIYDSARFDLHVSITKSAGTLIISINYAVSLFSESTISHFLANYRELLISLADQCDVPIDLLRILSPQERSLLLLEFNSTQTTYDKDKSFIDLFEEQALKTPANTALVFGATRFSYDLLNERCNQLARLLIQKGVKAETLVPICISRSAQMIIAILAVIKAGGTYVPIDPDYPADRVQYLLEDLETKLVLCDSSSEHLIAKNLQIEVINLSTDWYTITKLASDNLKMPYKPQNLAYVIYTSGSTGRPKGAGVFHSGIVNLLQWYIKEFNINNLDNTIIISSIAFDLTQKNIYSTLVAGGKLIIPEIAKFDSQAIINTIKAEKVTIINCAPNAFYPLVEDNDCLESIDSLRLVILGGEPIQLNRLERWLSEPSFKSEIVNSYGPTECTDIASFYRVGQPQRFINRNIPIGRPNDNVQLYILSQSAQLQPINAIGEIYIGGAGVGAGYLTDKDLTEKKFINSLSEFGKTLYKTGDLARWLPDGNIEYLGRIDHQVKINGNRIELGEIETIFHSFPGIRQAVVVVRDESNGLKRLIAYFAAEYDVDHVKLNVFLMSKLPKYMIPAVLIKLDRIPLTSNGKADRKALAEKVVRSPELLKYQITNSELATHITNLWKDSLALATIVIEDNFFELGGNSLLASNFVSALKRLYGYELPVTKLYQYPTIEGLCQFLSGKDQDRSIEVAKNESTAKKRDIAVIGMAGRFPGAETIEDLWDILKEGKETISFFSDDEIDSAIPTGLKNDPDYVKARGIIENAKNFDPAFFGLNVKLAQVMDPQQRIFLEIAWEVLEKTGHLPQKYKGEIGVYAGCGNNTYYLNNILKNKTIRDQVGEFRTMTVNEKDYISSRTAYQLNLKGPAVSVYSACSTSLLAVAQAVDAIRNGHCQVALAGGASITTPIKSGHLYQEGSMMSSDGHCRSFDASAKGTVFSDGAGVILLKDLEAAKNDGDEIFAVIKGIGLNNDGSDKGSFTSPNAEGQAYAIKKALADAAVDPDTLQYIEAHGTATPIGDPIELEGLRMAFSDQQHKQFCAIGSIKSNMGHLTAAAGVAGLIKTALALRHKKIPASVGFKQANTEIDFANSPFYVNTALKDWDSASIRRAGVSSFGIGGTNVHVIMEEFIDDRVFTVSDRPFELITWSAKSPASNERYAAKLAKFLEKDKALVLADIAYTLQKTRVGFDTRSYLVVSDLADLQRKLVGAYGGSEPNLSKDSSRQTVFMFPGQGTQYLDMGKDLYEHEIVYREAIDECANHLKEYLDTDIRSIIFPLSTDSITEERLNNTRYTQSALFATEYALGRLWISWGITPSVLCGHSLGEFVAGYFAGIFSLPDALKLVAIRGLMVSEQPTGSMMAVKMHVKEASKTLFKSLSVAAVNSDSLCVIAGQCEDITILAGLLGNQGVAFIMLNAQHAFHSAMMDPVVEAYKEVVTSIDLKRPLKPIISSVTGTWMTDQEAMDPQYWASHLRRTVLFSTVIDEILKVDHNVFLEIGPGNTLGGFVKQKASAETKVLISLPAGRNPQTDYECILQTLGLLWSKGLSPDWDAFYAGQIRRKINLPTYAFERIYCWVDPEDDSKEFSEEANKLMPLIQPSTQVEMKNYNSAKRERLTERITEIVVNTSGIEIDSPSFDRSFFEVGLDSLLLTQLALALKNHFKISVTFRQLNGELGTATLLLDYLIENLPEAYYDAEFPTQAANDVDHALFLVKPRDDSAVNETVLGMIAQQLELLTKQVEGLQEKNSFKNDSALTLTNYKQKSGALADGFKTSVEIDPDLKKPFGAMPRIDRVVVNLTKDQQIFLERLAHKYNLKTAKSKAYAQDHRAQMADPRVVSGFKPLTKEIIYPLVVNKSKGSKLWDIDGNEYIDVLNGFGSNFLGYQPEFIKNALNDQLEQGYEVGPQHELAGQVCKLVCEFTDFDRAALCNTGSEAVLGTMRIARTVTGRSLIVAFSNSYHGIMDEVLVRSSKNLKTFPAAPGIMPGAVQNMLILDYGTAESLKIIKERANELAAVLVEPVQSRRPDYQPLDFLKQVRKITSESGTALIFDEVITGFRMHPGGAQALFDIKADIASYGKVIGGGLPIGVIAGKKHFMDALDGGFWEFGDDSIPEVGVTYFAGTFVRHPLALASTNASLQYMKNAGPALQKRINQKAEKLALTLNREFESRGLPLYVAYFGSMWKIRFKAEIPYCELLFTLMRYKGIHVWDGFPCFMTEAHTAEEINSISELFLASLDEMTAAGFFSETTGVPTLSKDKFGDDQLKNPPIPNARLGRDKEGNPAWFVINPDIPGKYFQIDNK